MFLGFLYISMIYSGDGVECSSICTIDSFLGILFLLHKHIQHLYCSSFVHNFLNTFFVANFLDVEVQGNNFSEVFMMYKFTTCVYENGG